jgi:hypothetical protein
MGEGEEAESGQRIAGISGRASGPALTSDYPPNSIHLVRTAQQLTMQLSQMADQKASILMGATFVVFTVAIGQAGRAGMGWALSVLALFAFASAILAVTAVLPRVAPKNAPNDGNILFFGNFSRMSEAEFIAEVKSRLKHDDDFITAMLIDIHQNGSMLAARKYHYLALAYRTFVIGLTLTFAVFVAEQAMMRM